MDFNSKSDFKCKKSEEDCILLATTIAMQLSKGLSIEELEDLRCLINQISCSLTTLINSKCNNFRKK